MSRTDRKSAGPYRALDGLILGVCKGVAEYFGVSVFWLRFAAVVITLLTGLWPIVGIYLVAALLMKPEPVLPFENESDEEFYNTFASSRRMALHRLQRTYERLERRIARMESIVTDRERRWHERLSNGGL